MSKICEINGDIDLQVNIYSLVKAIAIGFNVNREEAIELVNKSLRDPRLNILELINLNFTQNSSKTN